MSRFGIRGRRTSQVTEELLETFAALSHSLLAHVHCKSELTKHEEAWHDGCPLTEDPHVLIREESAQSIPLQNWKIQDGTSILSDLYRAKMRALYKHEGQRAMRRAD